MHFIEGEMGCLWTRGFELILLSLCSGARGPLGQDGEGKGNRGYRGPSLAHGKQSEHVNCFLNDVF